MLKTLIAAGALLATLSSASATTLWASNPAHCANPDRYIENDSDIVLHSQPWEDELWTYTEFRGMGFQCSATSVGFTEQNTLEMNGQCFASGDEEYQEKFHMVVDSGMLYIMQGAQIEHLTFFELHGCN